MSAETFETSRLRFIPASHCKVLIKIITIINIFLDSIYQLGMMTVVNACYQQLPFQDLAYSRCLRSGTARTRFPTESCLRSKLLPLIALTLPAARIQAAILQLDGTMHQSEC